MTAVGELALWAALSIALWGALAGILAARGSDARSGDFAESAARALTATALLTLLAVAGLVAALLGRDYSRAYVVATTTANLPSVLRLAALLSQPAGALLVVAGLTAALAALALARVRRASGAPVSALSTTLLGAVLVLLVITVAAGPYSPAATPVEDGGGLGPAWQVAAVPLARLLLLIAGAIGTVAAALIAAGAPSRGWSLAAWGAGSAALLAALRRSLAGPPWGGMEWALLAGWIAIALFEYRRAGAARETVVLVLVGATASLLALSGTALRVDQRLPIASSESREFPGPLGSRWQITSEGLSSYEELNRLVSAVLVEVRRGRGTTRIARVEWRQYLNSRGDIVAQDIPVAGIVNGGLNTVVITPTEEPTLGGAVLDVRIIPLYGLWWVAAAFFLAAAMAGMRARSGSEQ